MLPETPPPNRHISSTPIPASTASSLLDKYISNSEAHPHLHPDALITSSGVTFSSHGGPTGGVIIHNLRRVAAGLRGEYLDPEKSPEPEEFSDSQPKKRKISRTGKTKLFGGAADPSQDSDWQNQSEYEREQVVDDGEIGARSNFVGEGDDAPEVEVIGSAEWADGEKKTNLDDKEARKQAKKERNKEFKKAKEAKRTKKD